jgi:hypothetical protein
MKFDLEKARALADDLASIATGKAQLAGMTPNGMPSWDCAIMLRAACDEIGWKCDFIEDLKSALDAERATVAKLRAVFGQFFIRHSVVDTTRIDPNWIEEVRQILKETNSGNS